MNCKECRRFLVAHIEDLLRPEAKKALEAHLDECRGCREEVSQMMHLHNRLTVDGKSYTVSDFESRVFERIFEEQAFESRRNEEDSRIDEPYGEGELLSIEAGPRIEEPLKTETLPRINKPRVNEAKAKKEQVRDVISLRRVFMNARIMKWAAAAVIIVGLGMGINIFFNQGAALAWEEVFSKVEQVNSVIYRMRVSMYGIALAPSGNVETESHVKFSTDYGMQLDSYTEGELTAHTYALLPEESIVAVIPKAKKFMMIKFTPEIFAKMRKENGDPKRMINDFTKYEHVELGRKTIDGVEVEGIESRDPHFAEGILGDVTARLWVEVETGWPYKMTIEVRGDDEELQMSMVMDNYQWGAQLEADEFAAVIPADYEELANVDLADLETGEAVVDGLGMFAELSGGRYPSDLTTATLVQELTELLDAKKQEGTLPDKPEKEMINGVMNLNMIGPFFGGLGAEDREPMYYGDTVTAVDFDKVLFRWKLEDEDNYRVIFGDLRIEDVDAKRLAELEGR